ncbi:MAG TPA: DUF2079 domain-containing protein [Polyangiaceae bacterium]
MEDIEQYAPGCRAYSHVPPFTRFVRASALLAVEGGVIGFALTTIRLWSRLSNFASTNKMSASDRSSILAWLMLPSVIWVVGSYARVLLRRNANPPLRALEIWAQQNAWLVAAGLAPVLFHPAVWRSKDLMFLITAAAAGGIAWATISLTQRGWRASGAGARESDLQSIVAFIKAVLPAKLLVLAPVLAIGIVVTYLVVRGALLDPTSVPRGPFPPPVHVVSLRQALLLLGHCGWLAIPVALVEFLRPPGHAHVLFWAACVSSAAFPIYAWARPRIGSFNALVVALLYLFLPVLRTVGRADVLPLGVATGAFFWTLYLWQRGNLWSALGCALLTIGLHEQAALWFVCVGLYMTRAGSTATTGRWIAGLCAGYFCVVALVVLPAFDFDPYRDSFKGLWGNDAVGLWETLRVAATNPAYVLSRWIDRQELTFWLALFVPFVFLPLVRRDAILWLMPGVLFAVVATGKSPSLPVSVAATAHFIVLGLVASIMTLARLHSAGATRHQVHAALFAWSYALIPCVYQLGALGVPAL